MKRCTLCKEEKEYELFTTQPSTKDGLHSWCKNCLARKRRERRARDPEAAREYERAAYAANPNSGRQKSAKYRSNNPEIIANYNLYWRKTYPEKMKRCKKSWSDRNLGLVYASNAERRAARLSAQPKWLSSDHKKEIRSIYKKSREMQKLDGVSYHVDHIIPLRGKNVCGLHVPWNLQIITASENMSKGNRM